MVAPQVVVIEELGQALFELTCQVVVLEQDLVLHGAVIALDLALGHQVIGLAAGMRHAMLRQPGTELGRGVGRPLSLNSRGRCRTRTRSKPELRRAIVNVSETSVAVMVVHSFQARM